MATVGFGVNEGSDQSIDTRSENVNSYLRAVNCIGDPLDGAGVAPVDGTNGLSVNVTNSSLAVSAVASITNEISADITSNTIGLATESGGNLDTIAGDTTSIDGKITACNTGAVTISSALPAGTNNIGDVDVLTMPATAGEGAALPSNFVVVAGDDGTNVSPLQTAANGDLKVTLDSEEVAVDISTNTAGLALETGGNLATIAGAVSGSEMQVDIVSSALPTGAATAANQTTLIGHVDGVEALLTTIDSDTSSLAGTVSGSEIQADIVAELPAGTQTIGKISPDDSDLSASTTLTKKFYTATTPTDGIVWSPAAGKRWYITDIFVNTSEAATITLEDDLAGGDSVVWQSQLAANSGWSHSFKTPLFSGEDAADLTVTADAGTVYITVTGYEA